MPSPRVQIIIRIELRIEPIMAAKDTRRYLHGKVADWLVRSARPRCHLRPADLDQGSSGPDNKQNSPSEAVDRDQLSQSDSILMPRPAARLAADASTSSQGMVRPFSDSTPRTPSSDVPRMAQ